MRYRCQWPGCDYRTDVKSQINYHHIKPVELNGSDAPSNRIYLCPTHHTKVFVPEAKSGMHTMKGEDSLIIHGWFQSTGGRVLQFSDLEGNIQYCDEQK